MKPKKKTIKDLQFSIEEHSHSYGKNIQFFSKTKWGTISILDRVTGYGYRDIESGYTDPDGYFWLASGKFDIRSYPDLTIHDAIQKIKDNANICIGYKQGKDK